MSFDIFDHKVIHPLAYIGLKNSFWELNLDTLEATWLGMILLTALALFGRHCLRNNKTRIVAGYQTVIGLFIRLCVDSFGYLQYNYFALISSLFFFTAICCLVGIIPHVEEATRDINTTFALGLTSFLYVQYQKIRVHSIRGYLQEFTEPFIALAPIHVIGELAKVASMSFRLFGNILGDSVILFMIIQLVALAKEEFLIFMTCTLLLAYITRLVFVREKVPFVAKLSSITLNILFIVTWTQLVLGIVTGMIQSFVITMLTTTYLAMGTTSDHHETDEHKETV